MIVGMIGVGEMGVEMAIHMATKGHQVYANDVIESRIADAVKRGAKAAPKIADMASADVYVVMVRTDDQARQVTKDILAGAKPGSVIGVAGTHHPDTMKELGAEAAARKVGFIDCPVVYGMDGARDGKLLSLCGGSEADVEKARPALLCYSRDALHVGPLGSGQIAKCCNNLLHWVHSVSNYETLLIAKRYGIDAQRMREVLLKAPAYNNTLERWDNTKFTWQEKDMDVVLDLAQAGGLVLPLTGQVDQLVKLFHADDVSALLHGPEASYLGRKITPLKPSEGGLG
ncbi:MAG TPA: NAD(P)-dependent oxidoreductase [Beijerinckiaceae bacterium]|jgi:3-hydroxyisobutyrate dehydrogenase-like beta-hydroxyacid dehydrogenase|nr:NAD(P)-dependent oxidoreductase [Beijerinckiaceae bacterium]